MKSNLFVIIKREYLERVRRKSFIIVTILMPVIMIVLTALPALIMYFSGPEKKTVAVYDQSGVIAQTLQGDEEFKFQPVGMASPLDSLKTSEAFDAVLVIGADIVENPSNVQFYTHSAPSLSTDMFLTSQLEKTISNIRKKSLDIPDLDKILARVDVNVKMSTYRLDNQEEKETSAGASYFIALAADMIMYMFILIYGQMVMTSIIEEKNNRVLELVVSSVKPKTLMLGKVIGIGCVAVTQILIWGVLVGCFSGWGMAPMIAKIDTDDPEIMAGLSQLADTGYILSLFGYIILFLVAGYMLYSSFYAAIGSSVDNLQDASQLTTIATVPIIAGIMISMVAMQDPNSSLSVWCSMIPLTSPLVMISRIPFGIPSWQIWTSLAILVASFMFMIWLSAKIYRVGIFMYGKKPGLKDLMRWARYK